MTENNNNEQLTELKEILDMVQEEKNKKNKPKNSASLLQSILDAPLINSEYTNDITWSSLTTNSRDVCQNSLFVALTTDGGDGHNYLLDAKNKGASLAIVSKTNDILPSIVVPDTLSTLQTIAKKLIASYKGEVIGITGSVGKTTTKEITAGILSKISPTYRSKRSFNNHLGVPTSISELADEKFAVFELGANHTGEIDYLSSILEPMRSVITNINMAHIGNYSSLEEIAHTKGEIIANTKHVVALSGDDVFFPLLKAKITHQELITFGLEGNWDWTLKGIDEGVAGTIYLFSHRGKTYTINTNLIGKHQASNILASLASTTGIEIPQNIILNVDTPGRLSFKFISNNLLIDDTYNCSPASVTSGLKVLAEKSKELQNESLFIFGGMAELGDFGSEIYEELAQLANSLELTKVFVVGDRAKVFFDAINVEKVFFDDKEHLYSYINNNSLAKTCILVKGSRNAKMEDIVNFLDKTYA